jgi:CDP-paratose 2-epimerase
MRQYFFGKEASTNWNKKELQKKYQSKYIHKNADIRNSLDIQKIFRKYKFDIIIHTAAQPSHDWATKEPYTDFSINATGTLIILENFRLYSPKATFIYTSTNKVYGDTPNNLPLVELDKRYEINKKHPYYKNGINESMSIDQSKHSIFGASKLAADLMVQEYGKYFGLNTGVFRGGCLTGPNHSGTELHGFLAYLIKCVATGKKYTVFGYKGKQVRDNIHSYDLVNMFWHYHQKPKQGEVYNAGGGRNSNISILEAIEKIEKIIGLKANIEYSNANRSGDHIWYISDVSKFKKQYPKWNYKYNIDQIIEEICHFGHFK